jgi:putative redox protein
VAECSVDGAVRQAQGGFQRSDAFTKESVVVEVSVSYSGALRCSAVHDPSGVTLFTDPPVDNHGRGESFSPTDLLATALGTCMLTLMGIHAGPLEPALSGARVTVRKIMTAAPPRRVARLEVAVVLPNGGGVAAADRARLEHAAHTCPVRLSLLEAIEIPATFAWG